VITPANGTASPEVAAGNGATPTDAAGNGAVRSSASRSTARTRAIIAMFGSALGLSIMAICAKGAARAGGATPLAGSEIALIRYVTGVIFLVVLSRVAKVNILGVDRRGLCIRGILGGIASLAYVIGIAGTSITHATLLNSTQVVFGPLVAVYALGERLKWISALALVAALTGVTLITHPQYGGSVNFGDAAALLSGIVSGFAVVQIRRLRQGESAYAVFFYFNLLGLPMSLLAGILHPQGWAIPTAAQWPLLMGMAASSIAGHILMSYAWRELTAAQGSPISLTSVVFSALFAYLIFGESVKAVTLVGGALILASALVMPLTRPQTKIQPVE
jgi:drug/metabolite transporter (DMT)-like permease